MRMEKVNALGIIAEDKSDINVITTLIKRLSQREKITTMARATGGSGNLINNADAYAEAMYRFGCNCLIIVTDNDRKNSSELRFKLERKVNECPIALKHIAIPVESIEAWLLADAEAVARVFNLKLKPNVKGNPETIEFPKNFLIDEVRRCSGKKGFYDPPTDNPRLAARLDLDLVAQRCASFRSFRQFVSSLQWA